MKVNIFWTGWKYVLVSQGQVYAKTLVLTGQFVVKKSNNC
jgi:hypothetical protein